MAAVDASLNVVLTVRNTRGSDMFIANEKETLVYGVQSKGQSGKDDIKIAKVNGELTIGRLQSDYWIITHEPLSVSPVCYILTKQEVFDRAIKDRDGQCWIKLARCEEFREAWHRIGNCSA